MSSNAGIQSLFAKAILDVHFLDTVAAKKDIWLPAQNEWLSVPPDSLQSLRLFSAFIAKVQHNYLWNDFPLTLTSIRKSGIELDIFGAYLPIHQQNRKIKPALGMEEKKNRFVNFFKAYTQNRKEPAYVKAHAIITHEEIYRQAKKKNITTDWPATPNSEKRPGRNSIPVVNGRVWLASLSINPSSIGNPLVKDNEVKMYIRKKRYCYWQEEQQEELRVFEVSKNTALVIEAIDGKKKISQLNALKGFSKKETAIGQEAIIVSLASAGIVSCI